MPQRLIENLQAATRHFHAYEQMKQEREENQQKKDLANINYWTNIAKAATVAVPILIAAGALAKGFVSPAK